VDLAVLGWQQQQVHVTRLASMPFLFCDVLVISALKITPYVSSACG
jgi:hypothetical protein